MNAKPMLLINDDQPQSMKVDVILKQRMGADDDWRPPIRQLVEHHLPAFSLGSAA